MIHQTFQLQKHFPSSPIYIMSDGGDRFDGLCQTIGVECTFKLCPPANDRWHPWPFMHRLRMAAVAMKTEYTFPQHDRNLSSLELLGGVLTYCIRCTARRCPCVAP